MEFALTTPCNNCPFRTDVTFPLYPHRVTEICDALFQHGGTFACHKTTHGTWGEDEDGETYYRDTGTEQHCAGALIMLEKHGGVSQNQMLRIAMRLRLLFPERLDMAAPVFATPAAMKRRMQRLLRKEQSVCPTL